MIKLDTDLHKDIIEELAFDPSVDERDIAVAVTGGVVTLTGLTKTYAQKLAAERAVKRVRGVRGLAEELTIDIPALHRRSDVDIVKSAVEALRWNTNIPTDSVIVKVENGLATLTGTVDWQYQREAARLAVGTLGGVRGVLNDITLRQRLVANDIKVKIHDSFQRNADIDANHIKVETSGGTVTLRGSVHSFAQRDEAANAAYSISGVLEVKNLTTVA